MFAMIIGMIKKIQKCPKAIPTARPAAVAGDKSPYPIVSAVTDAHHKPSKKDLFSATANREAPRIKEAK